MVDCIDMTQEPQPKKTRVLVPTTPFGKRIRRLREERGYSQEELALLSGVSRTLIAKYETNRLNPLVGRLDSFLRLSRALRVSIDDMVRGISVPRTKPHVRQR
jgi:transcriptional regulator with XRE-family HTH domain